MGNKYENFCYIVGRMILEKNNNSEIFIGKNVFCVYLVGCMYIG